MTEFQRAMFFVGITKELSRAEIDRLLEKFDKKKLVAIVQKPLHDMDALFGGNDEAVLGSLQVLMAEVFPDAINR